MQEPVLELAPVPVPVPVLVPALALALVLAGNPVAASYCKAAVSSRRLNPNWPKPAPLQGGR